MKIIKATSSHIPSVARLYVDSWRITYKGLVPDAYLKSLSYEQSEKNGPFFLPSLLILFCSLSMNEERLSAFQQVSLICPVLKYTRYTFARKCKIKELVTFYFLIQ